MLGKGGVGKSTVTANIARSLATVHDQEVGVLDIDLCGPSQPTILGCQVSINILHHHINITGSVLKILTISLNVSKHLKL